LPFDDDYHGKDVGVVVKTVDARLEERDGEYRGITYR
jgi:hypothetical protein